VSVETYGEHAENAARALNQLVRTDMIPTDPTAVDQLLHCREAVVDAVRQRLYDIGLNTWHPGPELLPTRASLDLVGVDDKLAGLLDNIAFALPSLPVEERLAPTDVLGTISPDPVVETWREAALELLAATHALDMAKDKPWLRDPGAGWYLLGDLAVAIEAVLVLDSRLDEVGLLTGHDRPEVTLGLEEKRLIASQTARAATWFATSDAVDLATPRTLAIASNVLHPVELVAAPEDFAPAQERLATFLRPLAAYDPAYAGEPEISADSARQITASQLYLCHAFTAMATGSPKTTGFAAFFEQRAEVLADLQPQLRYLVDVSPQEPNMRRFWQQGELTTALARMQDQHVALRLQPHQMLALANATHQVTHNLGRALRRELLRGTSNLRDADPHRATGPARVARRSRLGTTVTDLINMPAPTSPVARFSSPLQRQALRRTLDLAPTAARTPSPYPAARCEHTAGYDR